MHLRLITILRKSAQVQRDTVFFAKVLTIMRGNLEQELDKFKVKKKKKTRKKITFMCACCASSVDCDFLEEISICCIDLLQTYPNIKIKHNALQGSS